MSEAFPQFETPAYLDIADVSLSRGENHLFDNLSLRVEPGDVIYVQGQNGIGKTSLLRLAAGFAQAESGTVTWSCGHQSCAPSHIIAYQSHHDAFKPTLKALEELSFWADMSGYKGDLEHVLETVNLDNKSHLQTAKLSAGQKRRLAMARLIVSQKPIWIMDEPAAAMDDEGATLIDHIVERHTLRRGSVILASHANAKSLAKNTRRLILDHAA